SSHVSWPTAGEVRGSVAHDIAKPATDAAHDHRDVHVEKVVVPDMNGDRIGASIELGAGLSMPRARSGRDERQQRDASANGVVTHATPGWVGCVSEPYVGRAALRSPNWTRRDRLRDGSPRNPSATFSSRSSARVPRARSSAGMLQETRPA